MEGSQGRGKTFLLPQLSVLPDREQAVNANDGHREGSFRGAVTNQQQGGE